MGKYVCSKGVTLVSENRLAGWLAKRNAKRRNKKEKQTAALKLKYSCMKMNIIAVQGLQSKKWCEASNTLKTFPRQSCDKQTALLKIHVNLKWFCSGPVLKTFIQIICICLFHRYEHDCAKINTYQNILNTASRKKIHIFTVINRSAALPMKQWRSGTIIISV